MDKKLPLICLLLSAAASIAAEPDGAATPPAPTPASAPPEPSATAPAPTLTTSSAPTPAAADNATSRNTAGERASTAEKTVGADVPKIEMQTVTDNTVCRTERPTGSRIAVKRCVSERTPADDARDDVLHREIEEMRMRQVYQQQARDAAAAAAVARSMAR